MPMYLCGTGKSGLFCQREWIHKIGSWNTSKSLTSFCPHLYLLITSQLTSRQDNCILSHWGDHTPNKWQIFRKVFFASNEVSTRSGCCFVILQLYDVCKGGWMGLNGITIHQYLTLCLQEYRSPEKFQVYNF